MLPQLRELYRRLDVPRRDWGKPSGAVIAFAHSLVVPAGRFVNEPLRLRKFQIAFIRDVYNPRDEQGSRVVRRAVLSVARRNGKTLLAAVLVLLHLVGPFKKPNSTIVSAATTRRQASIVYRYVRDMVRVNPRLSRRLQLIDSVKRMLHNEDGSTYEAISAEAGAQFGQGLDFVVYDELAQAKNRNLYNALMTSLGSQVEPLMLVISTQAANDTHLLSELIDYGEKINHSIIDDPSFVCHLHTVPMDAKLTDRSQWKKANPGIGDFRDDKEMKSAVDQAIEIPSQEAMTRVYYFNQRVRAESGFLSPDLWDENAGMVNDALFTDGRPVYGGLDLSSRADLTALVLACEDDEANVHLKAFAWTPGETIAERSHRDRAPYEAWVKEGYLFAPPGPTIDHDFVATDIMRITRGMNVVNIAYDRWHIQQMKDALARIDAIMPLSEFGQGFKSMSPAVSEFEALALNKRLRHGGHKVFKWCMANTSLERNPAGDRKPTKVREIERIDLTVAALMAVAVMKCVPDAYVEVTALIA